MRLAWHQAAQGESFWVSEEPVLRGICALMLCCVVLAPCSLSRLELRDPGWQPAQVMGKAFPGLVQRGHW